MGEAGELQEQLCSALCCLAEAYMGMAGDAQEVAEACEGLLLRAAQASPSSPEPMQVSLIIFSLHYGYTWHHAPKLVRRDLKLFWALATCGINPHAFLLQE